MLLAMHAVRYDVSYTVRAMLLELCYWSYNVRAMLLAGSKSIILWDDTFIYRLNSLLIKCFSFRVLTMALLLLVLMFVFNSCCLTKDISAIERDSCNGGGQNKQRRV